jgi:arginase family enzyme
MSKPTWYLASFSSVGGSGGGRQAPHSLLAYRNGNGVFHSRVAEVPVDHDSARNTSDNIRDVLKERHGDKGGYLVLGGDHSITTGIIEAREGCHLVLFDAHSDDYGEMFNRRTLDHGNWVNEVVGKNLLSGVTWFNYRDKKFDTQACKDLVKDIPKEGKVHVSVDIDVLDPHLFNWATSFPEQGGCTVDKLLEDIASINIENLDISLDFVEYDPTKDPNNGGAYVSSLIIDELLELIDA